MRPPSADCLTCRPQPFRRRPAWAGALSLPSATPSRTYKPGQSMLLGVYCADLALLVLVIVLECFVGHAATAQLNKGAGPREQVAAGKEGGGLQRAGVRCDAPKRAAQRVGARPLSPARLGGAAKVRFNTSGHAGAYS